jgi:peptidoglycan/xylan/chitin deacetylase (PgdA/CDA1 family)
MRSAIAGFLLLASAATLAPAAASECPGNPHALGTSRTVVVDPTEHTLLGGFQYRESLPLNDKEVVLTFDDGPLPPYSSRILDILASECVKATFFMVGRMARAYPQVVRRVFADGHTIANHSQSHPFTFHRMGVDQASREIEDGFASIRAALGDTGTVAPFFRFPGLLRQDAVERYLAAHGVSAWSVDFMADDWRHIRAQEVVRRAIDRLEVKRRGILLLHDIQPATALGLPALLAELKARGYRIVHVVPATADRPKTATTPEQWVVRRQGQGQGQALVQAVWPRVLPAGRAAKPPVLAAPSRDSVGIDSHNEVLPVVEKVRFGDTEVALPQEVVWPNPEQVAAVVDEQIFPIAGLPAPGADNFSAAGAWQARTARVARTGPVRRAGAAGAPAFARHLAGRPAAHSPAPGAAQKTAAAPALRPGIKTVNPPAPKAPRPVGHQIQLPKPSAEAPSPTQIGMN